VFENRVLRKMFGPKEEEVTGNWRKVYNEELCDVCPSQNIIWVVKSRGMKGMEHVACMGRRGMHTGFWW
jgi:hypothetical protein